MAGVQRDPIDRPGRRPPTGSQQLRRQRPPQTGNESVVTKHHAWVFRRFADSDQGYAQQQLLGLYRKFRHAMSTSFIEPLIRIPRAQQPGLKAISFETSGFEDQPSRGSTLWGQKK